MRHLTWTLAGAGAGALAALAVGAHALASPPAWSLRTNVSGKQVPAVLGAAIVPGATAGVLVGWAGWEVGAIRPAWGLAAATFAVLVLLAAAGAWDDRRGDESARGFAGHLGARRLTGGIVKIAAGGVAGLVAGLVVYPESLGMAALTALAVPLAANFFNLLDRAPGRTGKTALLVGIPLLALGNEQWVVVAAGTFGGVAALLPTDLGEKGMLGDTGANPVGGVIGLGLAISLDAAALIAVVGVLLALNAASERWSFSEVIARTPPLRAFDSIGRK